MSKRIFQIIGIVFVSVLITETIFYFAGNSLFQINDWFIVITKIVYITICTGFLDYIFFSNQQTVPADDEDAGCDHAHWGEIKDGYQYCQGCGIAILAPQPTCQQHKSELISEIEITDPNNAEELIEVVYVSRCENCGEITEKRIEAKAK